jgi:hypothetical protein
MGEEFRRSRELAVLVLQALPLPIPGTTDDDGTKADVLKD